MIPRPYQIRVLDDAWAAMQVQLNVLITAPCSAGKTILFSKLIQRLLRENPSFRALILVDREILVQQSADKLRTVAPELAMSIGIICASITATKRGDLPVTVASRQSLVGQLDSFPPVQLCICDEAHLMALPREDDPEPDQWAKIITRLRQYNPMMRMVGCTASPYRLGSGYIYGDRNKSTMVPYWQQVDAEITTRELLQGGYIAPLVGLVRVGEELSSDLSHVRMVAGEYNLGQLSDIMCRPVHVQSCVDAWKLHASDRKKTLVFCTTIEHATAVSDAFLNAGIKACAIHSKLPAVQMAISMHSLQTGEDKVFCSVAKLTTGLDVSDVDCIMLARPTKSTALYQQIVGRGQRLAEGKTDCLIIDLVGAAAEFGTDMDHLKVVVPYGGDGGEAPMKICPGENHDGTLCGQSVHASLRYCPHCGHEFPMTAEVEAAVGTLKKVKFNELPEPDVWDVDAVTYDIHESRSSGKRIIKVTYQCGPYSKFSEYLCLPDFYSGFAVARARTWWADRSDEPFPETVDEFMFLIDTLLEPARISVVKDGKYDRIVDCEFSDDIDAPIDELPPLVTSDTVPF